MPAGGRLISGSGWDERAWARSEITHRSVCQNLQICCNCVCGRNAASFSCVDCVSTTAPGLLDPSEDALKINLGFEMEIEAGFLSCKIGCLLKIVRCLIVSINVFLGPIGASDCSPSENLSSEASARGALRARVPKGRVHHKKETFSLTPMTFHSVMPLSWHLGGEKPVFLPHPLCIKGLRNLQAPHACSKGRPQRPFWLCQC